MTDRPTLQELIDAVRQHVETAVMPVVRGEPKLYFQTLVALNLLRIATREIGAAPELAAVEQHVLTALTGDSEGVPTARIRSLCASIRSGAFDDPEQFDMALQYLGHWVNAQLAVNNPALAQRMQVEHDSGQVAL
ncbi:MAG: hypothetical protein IT298_03125 [Chloroflexi bacterium]|jgi:hypothetical protein|nr:hypothetical protein [Anaerolineae bacterium]MCC6564731.1 hypothetical protein [Chloroflexota bacterium]MDL1917537.1 hypothetical protein [Anaerolineae bacterium CFX4]OQY81793.1 MAG: hypothetical protein B6D42_10565 [Anaerolineae bacterium UTCFX5]MBW7880909.1 hypothetical protein [Anaerolineae bacterium]